MSFVFLNGLKTMKKYFTFRRKPSFTEEAVKRAVQDVQSKKMTIRKASKHYKIPFTCLVRRCGENSILKGSQTVLTEKEEKDIVEWLLHVSSHGFPLTASELKDCVKTMLDLQGRQTIFNENRPGRSWFKSFLQRNEILSIRLSENLNKSRASVTEDNIRKWFDEVNPTYFTKKTELNCFFLQVSRYIQDKNVENIFQEPSRVFNFDETAIYLHPQKKRVITRKGAKNVYSVGSGNEKECLTVLLGCNANGDCPPAMVIYKYERVPAHIAKSLPSSLCMGLSKSGWMNGEVFYSYISQTFLPWAHEQNIQFPIVVFLDGHASHLTLPLCEFCNQNEIILVALPPNATHIMQPIDVGVIFPLKCLWKKKRDEWKKQFGHDFNRQHFGPLLKEALDELQEKKTMFANAFRACGKYISIHSIEIVSIFFYFFRFNTFRPERCQLQQNRSPSW